MAEQLLYSQIPPQGMDLPEESEHTCPPSFPGGFQGLPSPVGMELSMASISTVNSLLPPREYGATYTLDHAQAPSFSIRSETSAFSTVLPMRNTQIVNGQPTPPLFPDGNSQPSGLDFYALAQYQMDGFQAVNAPALPLSSSLSAPASAATPNSTVDQSPSPQQSVNSSPPRRRRNTTPSTTTKAGCEKQSEARAKFLERNRLAASKCRQKKKDQSNLLLAHCQALENTKRYLEDQFEELLAERRKVKSMLFQHVCCGSGAINTYLQAMVEDVTKQVVAMHKPRTSTIASEPIPTPQPADTAAFGFDGPAQFSPSNTPAWDGAARRNSMQSMTTDFSYSWTDIQHPEDMQADVDFDSLVDVTECA